MLSVTTPVKKVQSKIGKIWLHACWLRGRITGRWIQKEGPVRNGAQIKMSILIQNSYITMKTKIMTQSNSIAKSTSTKASNTSKTSTTPLNSQKLKFNEKWWDNKACKMKHHNLTSWVLIWNLGQTAAREQRICINIGVRARLPRKKTIAK